MLSTRPLILTLLFAITLLVVLAPSAVANGQDLQAHRRAAEAGRMLKKRIPYPSASATPASQEKDADSPVIGAAPDPDKDTTTSTTTSGSTTSTTSTTSTSTGTTTSTTGTNTTTSSSTSTTSTTSLTSANTTSSTSTSSTSPTVSLPPTTTPSAAPITASVTPPPAAVVTNTAGPVTVTFTSSSADRSPTSFPSTTGSSALSKTSITVIAVIASCIGGAIIIFTVIRKWKFGKSSSFDERMNPIDWQPAANDRGFDDGIPGHRRRGSASSHGSFHSGSEHAGNYGTGHGATANHGLGSELAHDFTAGPSHLAPVGEYADLARGPSMRETLNRGPSLNGGYNYGGQYGGYDTHGPRY